mmetsp:Transcript_11643/g.40780  ORF Transcript_11643/g.40780 Transcript_11643/m.40780 type:complete len:210 (-) Transcript_11643:377-1006(-)
MLHRAPDVAATHTHNSRRLCRARARPLPCHRRESARTITPARRCCGHGADSPPGLRRASAATTAAAQRRPPRSLSLSLTLARRRGCHRRSLPAAATNTISIAIRLLVAWACSWRRRRRRACAGGARRWCECERAGAVACRRRCSVVAGVRCGRLGARRDGVVLLQCGMMRAEGRARAAGCLGACVWRACARGAWWLSSPRSPRRRALGR